MKTFTFLRVNTFNVISGTHISYWPLSDFELIKTIPEPTSDDDDIIPDHIVVDEVVAVLNENQSQESIVLDILNNRILKIKKKLASWTKATGWVEV